MAETIGRLGPGTAADIVLLDSTDISMLGWAGHDAADHVALQAHPGVIDTVMVNGRFVKRDGRLLADLEAVRRLIDSTTEHVAETIQSRGGFGVPDRSIPRPPRAAED